MAKNGNQYTSLLDDPRMKLVLRALKQFDYKPDALLEVLNTAQEAFGYLPKELLLYIAKELNVPLSKVYGVSTFYHLFSFDPLGDHTCIVCTGTACYVKGAEDIVEALEENYNIEQGQTTPDGKFSVSVARCLGSCGLAPVLVLDGSVVGKATPESTLARIKKLLEEDDLKVEPVPG
jgi:bidirectional [NiFe] hydrogenase diaphorase subunit